jgi:hypothetical protein
VCLWPNCLYTGHFEWRVPIDDEHTLSVGWFIDELPGDTPFEQAVIPCWYAPIRDERTGRWIDSHVMNQAYGLTSEDLRDWASFSPIEIYWALKHDVTPTAARRWAREGLRICDIVRAIALAMKPEEVRQWANAGFAPADAVEAKQMGIPLEAALAWREAAFILPDAALLIHDGWTLEEAVNAR